LLDQFRSSFLPVGTFVDSAYNALDTVSVEALYKRGNSETTLLLQEILPLATFLKKFERPGRRIFCRYAGGGSSPFDAEIRVEGREVELGFLEPSYYIEVTTAEYPEQYLARESLRRYGFVYGGQSTKRIRAPDGTSDVESHAVARHAGDVAKHLTTLVHDAIVLKAAKSYPEPCLLVVDAVPDKPITLLEWANLAREMTPDLAASRFKGCWIADWVSNTAVEVRS
jgi:hypothetical protein